MEKTIKLIGNLARLANPEPFIVAGNEDLVFKIETEVPLNVLVVTFRNGTVEKTERYNNPISSFTVPKELLFGGDLDMVLTHYKNGNILKEWICKPLAILEKSVGWEVLDTFREEYNTLREKYENLDSIVHALIEAQTNSNAKVDMLINTTISNSGNIAELAALIKRIQH
jgi:hypothetical protein